MNNLEFTFCGIVFLRELSKNQNIGNVCSVSRSGKILVCWAVFSASYCTENASHSFLSLKLNTSRTEAKIGKFILRAKHFYILAFYTTT